MLINVFFKQGAMFLKLKLKSLALFLTFACSVCCVSINDVYAGKGQKGGGVVVLREPIDINRVDAKGMTQLHYYANRGQLSLVKRLVETFHADVSKKDLSGMTPLHYAAKSGRAFVVKWLLQYGGAAKEVNTQDKNGKTPLHYAASLPNPNTARYLIESGADLDITDNKGMKPSAYATEGYDLYAVRSYINSSGKRAAAIVPANLMVPGGAASTRSGMVVEVVDSNESAFPVARVNLRSTEPSGYHYVPHDPLPMVYMGRKRPGSDASSVSESISGVSHNAGISSHALPTMHVESKRPRTDSANRMPTRAGAAMPSIEAQTVTVPPVVTNASIDDVVRNTACDVNIAADELMWEMRELFGHTGVGAPLNSVWACPCADYNVDFYSALYPNLLPSWYRKFFL